MFGIYLGYTICVGKTTKSIFYGQGTHSAKVVLIVWPKIPQLPQNLSVQFVCSSPKLWDIIEKRFYQVSVVCEKQHGISAQKVQSTCSEQEFPDVVKRFFVFCYKKTANNAKFITDLTVQAVCTSKKNLFLHGVVQNCRHDKRPSRNP